MTTTEQRIPMIPSAPASVLKTLGTQVHQGDDALLGGGLSTNGKIILQPSVPDSWACMAQVASPRFAYDTLFQNGVGAYGRYVERYQPFDLSVLAGSRRKNATRETTSTLKAWLHDHRKNPYPTKGEKIMLAILTKMTLTQVSTWFANARRRLKKENKMTWLPRNKSGAREGEKGSSGTSHSGSEAGHSDSDDNDSDFESDDEGQRIPDSQDKEIGVTLKNEKGEKEPSEEFETETITSRLNMVAESRKGEKGMEQRKTAWRYEADADKHGGSLGLGNSPVNSLQRWVNVCFETQSPVDFPRELTPPHTPVELTKSTANFAPPQILCRKEERPVLDPRHERATQGAIQRTDAPLLTTKQEESSLTLSSLARLTETRPCILTSHRELDAVLALTSLASR